MYLAWLGFSILFGAAKVERTIMKTFEYHVKYSQSYNLKDDLEEIGRQGWELVNFIKEDKTMVFILVFKRESNKI